MFQSTFEFTFWLAAASLELLVGAQALPGGARLREREVFALRGNHFYALSLDALDLKLLFVSEHVS